MDLEQRTSPSSKSDGKTNEYMIDAPSGSIEEIDIHEPDVDRKSEITNSTVVVRFLSGQPLFPNDLDQLRTEIFTQNKIILTLQKDNEVLRKERKELLTRSKELQDYTANLEAKHSLLLSSLENEIVDAKRPKQMEKLNTINHESWNNIADTQKLNMQDHTLSDNNTDETRKAIKGGEGLFMQDFKRKENVTFQEGEGDNDDKISCIDKGFLGKKTALRNKANRARCECNFLQARVRELEETLNREKSLHVAQASLCIQETRLSERKNARIQQLEDAMAEKDKYMEVALQRLKSDADRLRSQYNERIAHLELQLRSKSAVENSTTADSLRIQVLEREINTLGERINKYKQLLWSNRYLAEKVSEHWEKHLADLKKDFTLQMRTLRQDHNDEINRLQCYHQSELRRMTEINKDTSDIKPLISKLMKSQGSSAPENFLVAMLERLNYLEKRYKEKEQSFEFEIAESKRVAEVEKRLSIEKMALIIDHKNEQINFFRIELDELLSRINSITNGHIT